MLSALIDKLMGSQRLSYRRLTCWLVCTAMGPFGFISGEDFVAVCLMYIGSDSAAKAVGAWRGGGV